MAYTKLDWQAGVTPLSEANMDHLETQYDELIALFNAHTILMAIADDDPAPLTMGASTILARLAAGNIIAATPAQLMALLSGSAGAEFLFNTQKIGGVVDPTTDQQVATKKYADDLITAYNTQGIIFVPVYAYQSIGQGTWALVINDAYLYNNLIENTATSANGDNISYNIFLDKGTYTLRIWSLDAANGGIVDIDIDAAEVASFDTYDAAPVATVHSQTGVVIAARGRKTLKFRLDGKHGSSGGYTLNLGAIALWRTA